ncbi:ThuA domain-containing protein [Neolewinella aurantiaca]|uniref:ThuA domain-containing protein n=1 Tax=Neolewinella aurantiaca TaxID=2602767 RepID=A0A5C7FM87_9BACT|nr:ThuA domain-containing protein [Neolewinella aurantiaca]TXF91180.1 ThuA domain-containing protein [Neolewinella aurantiaca]
MKNTLLLLCALLFFPLSGGAQIKVLIIDGQNNHVVWPKSTVMMKQYLESTGLFTVDVERTGTTWKGKTQAEYLSLATRQKTEDLNEPVSDPGFKPKFKRYDVVVSNFGWKAAPWPKSTRKKFEKFVAKGGGFVSIHAADNSFPHWPAYNRMIGLGGWGGRNEKSGPYVYYTNEGELRRDTSPGNAGQHGKRHEFPITVRDSAHPITKGMPPVWMTTADECYAKLRGPAEQMTILATGKDQSETAPTDRHEPVLMVLDYGKGRVFHSTLGHDTRSFESVGFIYSFLRGVEWAATGSVTQELPEDFPQAGASSSRTFILQDK